MADFSVSINFDISVKDVFIKDNKSEIILKKFVDNLTLTLGGMSVTETQLRWAGSSRTKGWRIYKAYDDLILSMITITDGDKTSIYLHLFSYNYLPPLRVEKCVCEYFDVIFIKNLSHGAFKK